MLLIPFCLSLFDEIIARQFTPGPNKSLSFYDSFRFGLDLLERGSD